MKPKNSLMTSSARALIWFVQSYKIEKNRLDLAQRIITIDKKE